jgi:L-alanine-DL-glutamate epimerase-like enolase superfamily enzyme
MEKNVTIEKIRRKLKRDNLYVRTIKDAFGNKCYIVVDINNVIQSSEQRMSLEELAEYAEIQQ